MKNSQDNVYLGPGEVYITEKPTVVSTVLGSCVAVTMYCERFRTGGICHAMLPVNQNDSSPFRYVDSSILYMINKFLSMGIRRDEIEVKLFGGGNVIYFSDENDTIGCKNVGTALAVIGREKLRLTVSDVNGSTGRKLLFHTHTGEIFMKRIGIRDLPCAESTS